MDQPLHWIEIVQFTGLGLIGLSYGIGRFWPTNAWTSWLMIAGIAIFCIGALCEIITNLHHK